MVGLCQFDFCRLEEVEYIKSVIIKLCFGIIKKECGIVVKVDKVLEGCLEVVPLWAIQEKMTFLPTAIAYTLGTCPTISEAWRTVAMMIPVAAVKPRTGKDYENVGNDAGSHVWGEVGSERRMQQSSDRLKVRQILTCYNGWCGTEDLVRKEKKLLFSCLSRDWRLQR